MNRLLAAALLMMSPFATGWAQDVSGHIEGRVLGPSGSPLASVIIEVEGPSPWGTRQAETDAKGRYRIRNLPVGDYTLRIRQIGLRPIVYDNVRVQLGWTVSVGDARMEPAPIVLEPILVVGDRHLINRTSTATGMHLAADALRSLPVQRNYRSVVTLLPQFNQSYLGDDEANAAGATGLENRYFIDGAEVTDPFRGLSATNLPYKFVRQLEVRTGGYEAEYRSALGGVINVVTHEGGNEFRAEPFGYLANNRIAGTPRQGALEPRKGDFQECDFGITLRGPFIRDRLRYFVAYNPTVRREQVDIPGLGFFDDQETIHAFAAKLTLQATAKTSATLTSFGDLTDRRGVGEVFGTFGIPASFTNPDPYLQDLASGGINLSLTANHSINRNMFLDASLARVTRRERNLPATERGWDEGLVIDAETGIWSGGSPSRLDNRSVQTTAAFNLTVLLDRHALKAGVGFRDNRLDHDWHSPALFRFGTDSYLHYELLRRGTVRNRIPSMFVQDSWLVGERLRMNLGLRWDGQYLIASTGQVVEEITSQYQPRIGFVYQPGRPGTQRIDGSFSRFYHELPTYFLSAHLVDGYQLFVFYDHDPRIEPAGGDTTGSRGLTPRHGNLGGQYYDEFNVGYERVLGGAATIGVRATYRTLRQAIENGFDSRAGTFLYGNPGKEPLWEYPGAQRKYVALELTAGNLSSSKDLKMFASYVLSRTYGNYPGLFNSDFNYPFPNANASFDFPETLVNGTGLLPNDRPHVFKFFGTKAFDFGFTVGGSLVWQSGTPLSEFGGSTLGPPFYNFIGQRGSAGRTPSIWDLNARFAQNLAGLVRWGGDTQLILDVFRLGSRRTPVAFEQVHYFNLDQDGSQVTPNPIYGKPTRFQPPMSLRVGVDMTF